MSILCHLFGHQPPVYAKRGWWSPGETYAEVKVFATDGIGRQHANIYSECPRCNRNFLLCRIHVPKDNE